MRILILVPDLNPPWSEGRKAFVCDLLPELSSEWAVTILSTQIGASYTTPFSVPTKYVKCRHKFTQLPAMHHGLVQHLNMAPKPDAILHFPFGTFSGLRGIANRYSIATVDTIARQAGVPCLTILYSMTHGDLARLSRRVRHLVVGEGHGWDGLTLNIGIDLERFPLVWPGRNEKSLLFMAGYSENQHSLLQDVFHERGLMQLIHIGDRLAKHGYSLSIAIPLLRFKERCDELTDALARYAPKLIVRFISAATPVELFASHSMYIFPFSTSYTRFMPTSLLEAMACGIPVVAPRLPMLSAIVRPDDAYCQGFTPGDGDSLLKCIRRSETCWPEIAGRASSAGVMIRKNWSIRNSANQLKEMLKKIAHKPD